MLGGFFVATLLTESVCSLHDAAKSLPLSHGQKPINFTTIWRWAMKGILSQTGERVKLEAVRMGGRWITSREAIARFSAALTAKATAEPIRTPAARTRASETAKKKLAAIGI